MKRTKQALRWITGILKSRRVPFQITGGLAARIYGATRPLADIDIDIPTLGLRRIVAMISGRLIYGPRRYKDRNWDLTLATLLYGGQLIDLCAIETEKIFNRTSGKWEKLKIKLGEAVRRSVLGVSVPVIPLERLISYKSKLGRRVDVKDARAISDRPTVRCRGRRPRSVRP